MDSLCGFSVFTIMFINTVHFSPEYMTVHYLKINTNFRSHHVHIKHAHEGNCRYLPVRILVAAYFLVHFKGHTKQNWSHGKILDQ